MLPTRYRINGFILSADLETAVRENHTIELTFQERKALKAFFTSADGFVETKILESVIWPDRVVTDNSVRRLLSSLRAKFDSTEVIKNIRGKGYQLSFETVSIEATQKHKKPPPKLLVAALAILVVLTSVISIQHFSGNASPLKIPSVSTQTVFESSDYILDYALFNESLYVTTRTKNSSTLYKVTNRQNVALMTADFPGAYRGLEINANGRTILHVIEDSKCKIKIYAKPVETLLSEIPCNRQNAFPSFDWIDDSRFYVTLTVPPNTSVKPYVFDLNTKHLEEFTAINFNRPDGKHFVDSFIKARGDGMFSLRQNHLEQMSLMYFEGDDRRTLYQFRGKPYSLGVSDNALYFVGNNNELLEVKLENDVLSQSMTTSLLLPPQASKIDDPLILQGDLYFSLGNTAKEIINSASGNFTFSIENGIRDFHYVNGVLTILAITNTGYVIEQIKNGSVFNSSYVDTPYNIRHVAYHKDQVYLAGASGIFVLADGVLNPISPIRAAQLAANSHCLMVQADNSIYLFNENEAQLNKIATQGERAFAGETNCFYVDKLTGYIYNEQQERITKPRKNKLLFEHQGRIVFWQSVGDQTQIIDNETEEIIATTKHRALFLRVISFEDDFLYLGHADVHPSIMKVNRL